MLSSAANIPDNEHLVANGFSGYLFKPLSKTQFQYVLECLYAEYQKQKAPPKWLNLSTHITHPVLKQYSPVVPKIEIIETPDTHPIRVLLTEDNEINSMVAANMLHRLHCQIDMATTGRQALQIWQTAIQAKKNYDLILMDVQMPEMDGFETTQWIRHYEKEYNITTPTPIIAVTANAMKEDKERCLTAGMNDYLAKPFGIDQLSALINKYYHPKIVVEPVISTQPSPIQETTVIVDFKDLPVFDEQQLRRVVIGNLNLLKKVVAIFTEDTELQINKLFQLLETLNDLKTTERIFHSIKGESRNMGALRLGECAFYGEQAIKKQHIEKAKETLPLLKTEFEQLKQHWLTIDWDTFLK
jgi:CheY-like chemotaxis protein